MMETFPLPAPAVPALHRLRFLSHPLWANQLSGAQATSCRHGATRRPLINKDSGSCGCALDTQSLARYGLGQEQGVVAV